LALIYNIDFGTCVLFMSIQDSLEIDFISLVNKAKELVNMYII
jgi:hypothetical protein